jgi:hypothetical protein
MNTPDEYAEEAVKCLGWMTGDGDEQQRNVLRGIGYAILSLRTEPQHAPQGSMETTKEDVYRRGSRNAELLLAAEGDDYPIDEKDWGR